MRNFSSCVPFVATFALDETTTLTDPSFVRVHDALLISMGANPRLMAPSEERVIADFIEWVTNNLRACGWSKGVIPGSQLAAEVVKISPVFFYANLNEGHSVAVVWTDAKGKMNYLL